LSKIQQVLGTQSIFHNFKKLDACEDKLLFYNWQILSEKMLSNPAIDDS